MSRILKKSFNKTIDYSEDKIDLFKKEVRNKSSKENLDIVKEIISNAKENIFIASTSDLDSTISGELQSAINSGVRIYMILNDFSKVGKTLSVYSKNSLIREVKGLDNNFIIVDKNISLLFLDDLSNIKNNQLIELGSKESEGVFYWGSYYFWMKSSVEIVDGNIQKVSDSPFDIPDDIEKEYINLYSFSNADLFDELYLPLEKKSKEFFNNYKFKNLYLNPNNKVKIAINKNKSILGNFKINQNISEKINENWKFYKDIKLKNIDYEIIPFDKNWHKNSIVTIQDIDEVNLKDMEAGTIEDMENTIPDFSSYKKEYIRKITYKWTVIPPQLPKKAKKSKYYKEWDNLQNDFNKKLKFLKDIATNIANGEGVKEKFKNFFTGKKRKMKEVLNKIEEYENINLSEMDKNEVDNFLNKEFNEFYNKIIKSQKEYKEEIDKREEEEKFNNEKKEIQNKIFDINEKIISYEEDYEKEQKKLKDKIKELENKILLKSKEKLKSDTSTLLSKQISDKKNNKINEVK